MPSGILIFKYFSRLLKQIQESDEEKAPKVAFSLLWKPFSIELSGVFFLNMISILTFVRSCTTVANLSVSRSLVIDPKSRDFASV